MRSSTKGMITIIPVTMNTIRDDIKNIIDIINFSHLYGLKVGT